MIHAHLQCVHDLDNFAPCKHDRGCNGTILRTGGLNIRGTPSSAVATSNAYISRTHLCTQHLLSAYVLVHFRTSVCPAMGCWQPVRHAATRIKAADVLERP